MNSNIKKIITLAEMLIEDTFIYAKENNVTTIQVCESIYDDLVKFHHLAGDDVTFVMGDPDDNWINFIDNVLDCNYFYTLLGLFRSDNGNQGNSGYITDHIRPATLKYAIDNNIKANNCTLIAGYLYGLFSSKQQNEPLEVSFSKHIKSSLLNSIWRMTTDTEDLPLFRSLIPIIVADDEQVAKYYLRRESHFVTNIELTPYNGKLEFLRFFSSEYVLNTETEIIVFEVDDNSIPEHRIKTRTYRKKGNATTYKFRGEEYVVSDDGFLVLVMQYIDNHCDNIPILEHEDLSQHLTTYEILAQNRSI